MATSIAQERVRTHENFAPVPDPPWLGLVQADIDLGYALGWVQDEIVEDYLRRVRRAILAHIAADKATAKQQKQAAA